MQVAARDRSYSNEVLGSAVRVPRWRYWQPISVVQYSVCVDEIYVLQLASRHECFHWTLLILVCECETYFRFEETKGQNIRTVYDLDDERH
jgi:hypothetical protein